MIPLTVPVLLVILPMFLTLPPLTDPRKMPDRLCTITLPSPAAKTEINTCVLATCRFEIGAPTACGAGRRISLIAEPTESLMDVLCDGNNEVFPEDKKTRFLSF